MTEAAQTHIALAQAQHQRLVTAERALMVMRVSVGINLYRDLAGRDARQLYESGEIELSVMIPIEQQPDFQNFFVSTGLDRASCTFDVDVSKKLIELGIDSLDTICVFSETIPAHLLPPSANLSNMASLNLRVVTPDGNEIYFKCRPTTPFERLFQAFCNRQGLSMGDVRFLFDGLRLNGSQTPQEVDMEDGDVIDAVGI